ncbi:MAG: hypothetical protein IPL06_15865 [Betaproteobacteria bacterium]|nr:hypothetical protein [Betaproteobacteria bacterium]
MTHPAEQLSASEFPQALREALRFRPEPVIGDPLAVVLARVERDPAFSQSRMLTRILVALTYGEGGFRRAEIAGLDAPTHALAITLLDAFGAGKTPRAEWERAVAAARAAQTGAS